MLIKTAILTFVLAQTGCLTSIVLAAERNNDSEPLKKLSPPLTVEGGPIRGEGNARKAELMIKSDSNRSISELVVQVLLLDSDGRVTGSVPHTRSGLVGADGNNTLDRGESYRLEVANIFIKDNDIAAVDGFVSKITFDDNSTWPPMPKNPPEKVTGEPVAVKMIGVQGKGEKTQAVVACFNYESKSIKEVLYQIEYLDADGKRLKSTTHGYSSSSPIMERDAGVVISGGDGPPDKATGVQERVTRAKFSDGTEWKQAD